MNKMQRLTKVLFILSNLLLLVAAEDLEEQNQDYLNPVEDYEYQHQEQQVDKEHDKRTIFSSGPKWAKHVAVHPAGFKYFIGYGPVDYKYVPVVRPVAFKPPHVHKIIPSVPPVIHHDGWKPVVVHKPWNSVKPVHVHHPVTVVQPPPRPLPVVPVHPPQPLPVHPPPHIRPVHVPFHGTGSVEFHGNRDLVPLVGPHVQTVVHPHVHQFPSFRIPHVHQFVPGVPHVHQFVPQVHQFPLPGIPNVHQLPNGIPHVHQLAPEVPHVHQFPQPGIPNVHQLPNGIPHVHQFPPQVPHVHQYAPELPHVHPSPHVPFGEPNLVPEDIPQPDFRHQYPGVHPDVPIQQLPLDHHHIPFNLQPSGNINPSVFNNYQPELNQDLPVDGVPNDFRASPPLLINQQLPGNIQHLFNQQIQHGEGATSSILLHGAINPGNTDLQFPQHLPHHPNYPQDGNQRREDNESDEEASEK